MSTPEHAAFPTGPELAQLAFEQMRARYAAAPVGSLTITELALIAIAGSLVGAPVLALPGADMMAGLDVVPHDLVREVHMGIERALDEPMIATGPADEGPACTCAARKPGGPPCPRTEYIWGGGADDDLAERGEP